MNKEKWKYERVGGREQSIFICEESLEGEGEEEEEGFGEVCECTKMGLATCFFPFLPFFIVTQSLSFALAAMMPCDSEWERKRFEISKQSKNVSTFNVITKVAPPSSKRKQYPYLIHHFLVP